MNLDDSLKMKVKVNGKGSPLLLLPGGLTGWNSWQSFVDDFTNRQKKVIQVQLLNVDYGIADRTLPENYSIRTESKALAATLDSKEQRKPLDIVGWSYGALVALDYALEHPDKIRSLTLIEPPAIWILRAEGSMDSETKQTVDFFETFRGNITIEMLADFLRTNKLLKENQSPEELVQWQEWVRYRQSLRNNLAIVNQRDKLKRLQNFEPPVLLIKGTGSAPFLHRIIDILNSNIPNSRVIEMPSGHAPHILSKAKFLSELENFHKELDY